MVLLNLNKYDALQCIAAQNTLTRTQPYIEFQNRLKTHAYSRTQAHIQCNCYQSKGIQTDLMCKQCTKCKTCKHGERGRRKISIIGFTVCCACLLFVFVTQTDSNEIVCHMKISILEVSLFLHKLVIGNQIDYIPKHSNPIESNMRTCAVLCIC